MASKKLTAAYAFFAFCLLVASALLIALSVVWMAPNLTLNFMIPSQFLTAGIVLGAMYAVTVLASIVSIVQRNHITAPLMYLNWVLLLDGLATVVIGTMIWFFTLREEDNYYVRFQATTDSIREQLQNEFSCCGYFFPNDTAVIGGYCANTTFAATQPGCVLPIIDAGDFILNNIFTSTYGFMAVIIGLFLMSLCVINQRMEAERFRKIDSKRGGRGFV